MLYHALKHEGPTMPLFFSRAAKVVATAFVFLMPSALAQQSVLSVLCPASLIDSKTLAGFEKKNKIALRVELTTSPREFEQRIRSSVNMFDVVIADENELTTLSSARLLRPLNDPRFTEKSQGKLAAPSKTQRESKSYTNLMVEPLGIAWLDETRSSPTAPTWTEFANPAENPLWRGRIFLPLDKQLQLRLAMLSAGIFNAIPSQEELSKVTDARNWLSKALAQTRMGGSQLVLELLKKRVVAAALWKSDYLRVRHTVPELSFGAPPTTFFRRIGAAIVADTLHEEAATNFVAHVFESRDELARFAGLIPLGVADQKESDVLKWALYDDTIAPNASLEKDIVSGPLKRP